MPVKADGGERGTVTAQGLKEQIFSFSNWGITVVERLGEHKFAGRW